MQTFKQAQLEYRRQKAWDICECGPEMVREAKRYGTCLSGTCPFAWRVTGFDSLQALEAELVEGDAMANPQDTEILEMVGAGMNPDDLIAALSGKYSMDNVIEGLQRAIEREKITLDRAGMVVAVPLVTGGGR